MNTDIEELAQYLWTYLTSTPSVVLRIMQKFIQPLSFSTLQDPMATTPESWSVPASGKITTRPSPDRTYQSRNDRFLAGDTHRQLSAVEAERTVMTLSNRPLMFMPFHFTIMLY
jgi:hypothetical protein